MNCEQASALLSAQLDGEIQADEQSRLDVHLSACPECGATAEVNRAQDADLRQAFAPRREAVARVVEQVTAELRSGAAVEKKRSPSRAKRGPLGRSAARRLTLVASAAALAGLAFLVQEIHHTPGQQSGAVPEAAPRARHDRWDWLTPRPRPAAPPAERIAVGQTVRTGPGQRRRVGLSDGSVLYLNQNTTATLDGERHVMLAEGEVFVEVAPAPHPQPLSPEGRGEKRGLSPEGRGEKERGTFVVQTPTRSVTALGTKFDVKAEPVGTSVAVTQGKVWLSGLADVVPAGLQVGPGSAAPAPAPRASYLLDWTKDLMAAAESPLVPGSKYAGGALIARDPYGQEARLSLRKYHIDVHIEDGFARTTIDQTYFNHDTARLEGTFYFPLPADASLSRLAMYVGGNLMEGGMAERNHARNVFEEIVTRQKDPALLEWVDGSTFKMRVFPLEGRQEKRIILSYTQRLPALYGETQYRFPAGHSLSVVRDWSFHARVKGGQGLGWSSDSHSLKESADGRDLLLNARAVDIKPDRDVTLRLYDAAGDRPGGADIPVRQPGGQECPPHINAGSHGVSGTDILVRQCGGQECPPHMNTGGSADQVRFSSAEHEGARYLMVRYRPDIGGTQAPVRPRARNWVILFESSGDRDPLLARAQVEVVRTLLANVEHDDTFAVLTAGTFVRAFRDEPVPATPANVQAALAFLDQAHLVGALNLGQALAAAGPYLRSERSPYLVHVGSGVPAMGERREDVLARAVPDGARYVGVGIGRRWARGFMKSAAERTGGYFTQINPDEQIPWRAFELLATLNAPRLLGARVVDNGERATFLTYAGSLVQGEELCAIARLARGEKRLPASVTIAGTVDGQPFRRIVPVKDVAEHADYLPRTWARLEIDRLLAEDAAKNKDRIVELSKAMYVISPFTSLLVLENEEMYRQYQVDRGRKDHWAMYPCPEKIPVVYEPDPNQPLDSGVPAEGQKPSLTQVLQSVVVRTPAGFLSRSGVQNTLPVRRRDRRRSAFDEWLYESREREVVLEDLGAAPDPAVVPDNDVTWRSSYDIDGKIAKLHSNLGDGEVPRNWTYYSADEKPPARVGQIMIVGNELARQNVISRQVPQFPGQILTWGEYRLPEAGRNLSDGRDALFETLTKEESAIKVARQIQLLNESENLRALENERERFWALDHPSHLGDERVDGGMQAGPSEGEIAARARGDDGTTFGIWNAASDMEITFNRRVEQNKSSRPGFPVADLILDVEQTQTGSLLFGNSVSHDANIGHVDANAALIDRFRAHRRVRKAGLPVYQPPSFSGDERLFSDLLGYAPGMNTQQADVQAVLEAEAAPRLSDAPGTIDLAARRLIDRARTAGWQTLGVPGPGGASGFALTFDGRGRFACERTTPLGLREQVVCDGTSLLYLYPELGVGARRHVSRFHRAEMSQVLPWLLPPAEDLAHGADVRFIDEHTVAVVPHGAATAKTADGKPVNYLAIQLVFGPDGRFAERRLVVMPTGKVLLRETYDSGTVKVIDGEGKERSVRKFALRPAAEPDLKPDLSKLVVLPLPFRSRDQVYRSLYLEPNNGLDTGENRCYEYLDADKALALFAAEFAAGNGTNAKQVFRNCFQARGDRRLGFYTLLAACGIDVSAPRESLNVLAEYPHEPVAGYLALLQNRGYRLVQQSWGLSCGWAAGAEGSFFQRLATLRDLYLRWQNGNANATWAWQRRAEQERALDFVRRNRSSVLGLAALCLVQAHAGNDEQFHRELAEAWRLFEDSGLADAARYERARNLLDGGRRQEARQLFRELYAEATKRGVLPPIDASFRQALQGEGEGEGWGDLMRRTAGSLVEQKRRPAVVALAWQCRQLGDEPLAEQLLAVALDGMTDDAERLATSLTAVGYLVQTGQLAYADHLLQPLLENRLLARSPVLWRLAQTIAERRGRTTQALSCLERALDLEFGHLPDVINLQTVRAEYGKLMQQYQSLAAALPALNVPPPADLTARVIRTADRWRALDPEGAAACQSAAQALKALGATDAAWEYLTTPLGLRPNEADPWLGLAQTLGREGDLELADRAYEAAFEAEPTNAQILWDRAQNLRQAGKSAESRDVLRRLAEGKWQPRFGGIQEQARQLVVR